jgi:DNA-directed RNA polymerase specialized sigma24 family protein
MTSHAQISDAHAASAQGIRPRVFAIRHRVLASAADADDVVQDAWMR